MMVALLIGITAWPWTTRSVRSQVISLRNRDHVNLSKLSGHSMLRIVLTDILPYVASYVVMAFILRFPPEFWQSTTFYDRTWTGDHKDCNTWSYDAMGNPVQCTLKRCMVGIFPVILVIALISFSLNLMNTGLDQVFNPQLRD